MWLQTAPTDQADLSGHLNSPSINKLSKRIKNADVGKKSSGQYVFGQIYVKVGHTDTHTLWRRHDIKRGLYTSGHFIWNLSNNPSASLITFI